MPMLTIELDGIGATPVNYTERGAGRTFLLLHGGAGLQSVTGFADTLAVAAPGHVIVPAHPGFDGTPRPSGLADIRALAALYTGLLDELDLAGVTVIGNSMGGWIAAEMAIAGSARMADVVLVDAVGILVPGHPVADFFALTLDQVADLSYHDPGRFRIDPASMSTEQRAVMAGNRAALAAYAGTGMLDASLGGRLAQVQVPALVVWGDIDRIVDPGYGLAFAAAIPGAHFRLLAATGHVPQLESPAELLATVLDFTCSRSAAD